MSSANLALFHAAQAGDPERLEIAIRRGADIHAEKELQPFESAPPSPVETGIAALNAAIRATDDKELTAGHLKVIERLLELGVDVNQNLSPRDSSSYPLHLAAHSGHEELVRLLLNRGATLFTKGPERAALLRWAAYKGQTWLMQQLLRIVTTPLYTGVARDLEVALYSATRFGHIEIIRMLLDLGVSADAREGESGLGNTALMHAASSRHPECVALLRSHGADIWAQGDRGLTVLIAAANGGITDLALELIEGGSDPNATDFYDRTPLYFAALSGSDEIARALVAHGAKLRAYDSGKDSILSGAAFGGLNWLAEACLQAGEPVDSENDWGYTPLMNAAKAGHVETMQLLVSCGAKINHVAHYQGETALHYAIYGKQLAAARWLVEHGADLNAEMQDIGIGPLTPLMNAAVSNQPEMAEMLLQAGADVSATESEENETALHYAVWSKSADMVEILVRHGADVNACNLQQSIPIGRAALIGDSEITRRLIEAGANIHARDSIGQTPLHLVVLSGNVTVVRLLLQAGANPTIAQNDGETPLSLAEAAGNSQIIDALRSGNS